MRKLYFGVAMLLLLLILGIWLTVSMNSLHGRIQEDMTRAAEAACREDWPAAREAAGNARELWQKRRRFAAALLDHGPLEETDALFAELEVYDKRGMAADFAAVCALLAQQAEAMGESQQLRWWNFL